MLNSITINSQKIKNGLWLDLLQSKFLIASVESSNFKQAVIDANGKQLDDNLLIAIMADTLLLDWSDVKDKNGNDVQYSKAMAVIALKTNQQLRDFVDSTSTNFGLYCEQS